MPSYRLMNKLGGKLSMHQDEEIIRVGNDVWIGVGVVIPRKSGLTIGDGAGKNWWCVMYPSLCVGAASADDMKEELDRGEYRVVTSDKFDFRFRLVEYFEDVRGWFR